MNAEKQHKSIRRAWWLSFAVAAFVFALVQVLPLVGMYVQQDDPLQDIVYVPIQHEEVKQSGPQLPPGASNPVYQESFSALISIPSIRVNVPIVWSHSTKEQDLQHDLSNGAIHYPGTAVPGNVGNSLLAAHSSDYVWKEGKYKSAFASLNKLSVGDKDIFITYFDKDATQHTLRFQVTEKAIVAPNDTRIFAEDQRHQITLITCWPVGTNWRRLMVKADFLGEE